MSAETVHHSSNTYIILYVILPVWEIHYGDEIDLKSSYGISYVY